MCGHPRCPWGIGKHPATLADARDEVIVRRALLEAGSIPLAEAERRYQAWKATWWDRAAAAAPEAHQP